MRRIDGLPTAGALERRTIATIGVFDGLHLGHRSLIERLTTRAREADAQSVVFTFRQHPDALLQGRAPAPLQTLEDRLDGLAELGVDACFTLDFDDALRSMPVEEFLENILRRGIACAGLVLGHDSAIGRGREGTVERFSELGMPAERVEEVSVDGRAVSASTIRDALRLGDLELVHTMLGRRHRVRACVVEGDARGRELGFRTANLELPELCLPRDGVYAAWAMSTEFDRPLRAAVNLGMRPTFGASTRTLEAHLLDGFDRSLYGADVEVEFVRHLRDEMRFDSRASLVAQIRSDIDEARDTLERAG